MNATVCGEMWANYEEEKTLWNHKGEIMARCQRLLQNLGFYVQRRNLTHHRRRGVVAATATAGILPMPNTMEKDAPEENILVDD